MKNLIVEGCPVADGRGPCNHSCGGGWPGTNITTEAMTRGITRGVIDPYALGCQPLQDKAIQGYQETNPIRVATRYEDSIPIISSTECREAMDAMEAQVRQVAYDLKQVQIIPVLYGGEKVGWDIAHRLGGTVNPMRMEKYRPDGMLPRAQCTFDIDYERILTKGRIHDLFLFEAVVDSQDTGIQARKHLLDGCARRFPYAVPPEIHVFTLVSKIPPETEVKIPNFHAQLLLDHRIWGHGENCDDLCRGRGKEGIYGRIDPRVIEQGQPFPSRPYYQRLF